MLNIATIVGSLRKESINKKLVCAIHQLTNDCNWNILSLVDIPMFNQDDENNIPSSVKKIKEKVLQADGVLLATPEYNRAIPAVLKNIIDWGTRPYGNNVWKNKPVAIIGASPSMLGTAFSQLQLRNLMNTVGSITMRLPEVYLNYCEGDIDSNYTIANPDKRTILQNFTLEFIKLIKDNKQG